jgi:hypothetical protein
LRVCGGSAEALGDRESGALDAGCDIWQDRSRVRTGNAAQNLAVLRHMALNLLRHAPGKGSLKTKRLRTALDDGYLLEVLRQ